MDGALRGYARQVDAGTSAAVRWVLSPKRRAELERAPRRDLSRKIGITPYKFHVSEDIYTSILLHGDRDRNWKSVLHPTVEARMLSPQDLLSWATQRFKYAGGTLDIMLRDNPLFRAGMTLRQKLMYASTFWSYFSPFWVVIFLAAPLVSLFTGISPVEAYSSDFFLHLLPFLIIHELALIIGMWGIDNRDGRLISIAFFWLNIKAMWTVIRGREIRFHVTPKTRQSGRYLSVVAPHILIIALTVAALVTGVMRYVDNPGNEALGLLAVNAFWAGCNAIALSILVCAAFWRPPEEDASADESAKMAAGADATVTA
ncbi:MAG: glycosyltransferase [Pseudomonadota bacterium]